MPSLVWENRLRRDGFALVAGIDEAGRGPLAGPVVAAAVILPLRFRHQVLNDSKQLSPRVREELYREITCHGRILWSSGSASVEEIDRLNILRATHLAMQRAVDGLISAPHAILVDGLRVRAFGDELRQEAIVRGDSISMSIAAASIVAKVERDREMIALAEQYPDYGFECHKGYGTKQHLEAIDRHGPCPLHRRSFRPVSQLTFQFAEVQL